MENLISGPGLILPKHLSAEHRVVAKCQNPIPLSVLQYISNLIFYSRDDIPLDMIQTLSNHDTLLARSAAHENLQRNKPRTQIHEIGPGNFNFARAFVRNSRGLDNLLYTGHDFSEASHCHVAEEVSKLGIRFSKTSITEFPDKVQGSDFTVYLVEVLDDAITDFFSLYQGKERILCALPAIVYDEVIPSRAKFAQEQAMQGNFSRATYRMASKGLVRDYTPQDLVQLMEQTNVAQLMQAHPGFLRNISYNDLVGIEVPLEDLQRGPWKDMPEDFEKYRAQILEFFRGQLKQVPEGKFLHVPISGINLLYSIKDRNNINIHIFDYGYESDYESPLPFRVYNGQITASLNFGLLRFAGELFGYNARLEKNRDYIFRNLGINTHPLSNLRLGFNMSIEDSRELFYKAFGDIVRKLNPDNEVTPKNILSFRIPRESADAFLEVGKTEGFVAPDYQLKESTYHLELSKN